MTDDHCLRALSCYGSQMNTTPHLDRIAQEGMMFKHCLCTNALCAPSRAVILTGKYSHINGVKDNHTRFDGSQPTFPKLLQKGGYKTALIGKWHLKSEPTGFDYWNILPGQGVYYNPTFIEMGAPRKHPGYVTDLITDFCIDWLKQRSSDKPFCLLCHHKAPHGPWLPAPRHRNLFAKVEFPEPATFDDDFKTRSAAARDAELTIQYDLKPSQYLKLEQPKGLTDQAVKQWRYQNYLRGYLGCIASVDESVGRLLDYLDQASLTENTLVVYTSDQGRFLGEHGWFDKRFMYEQPLHMPLLVRHPRLILAGSVRDDIVLNLDFAPTFLDLAGIDVPKDIQGRSFKPILQRHRPKDWRTSMYYHYYEFPGTHSVKRHYGVRTERYKLIHFYNDIDAWELYDLLKDPNEVNNVYSNPAYADLVRKLRAELDRLRKLYGDTGRL
jgi:arylsulfatase A-like enzyme